MKIQIVKNGKDLPKVKSICPWYVDEPPVAPKN